MRVRDATAVGSGWRRRCWSLGRRFGRRFVGLIRCGGVSAVVVVGRGPGAIGGRRPLRAGTGFQLDDSSLGVTPCGVGLGLTPTLGAGPADGIDRSVEVTAGRTQRSRMLLRCLLGGLVRRPAAARPVGLPRPRAWPTPAASDRTGSPDRRDGSSWAVGDVDVDSACDEDAGFGPQRPPSTSARACADSGAGDGGAERFEACDAPALAVTVRVGAHRALEDRRHQLPHHPHGGGAEPVAAAPSAGHVTSRASMLDSTITQLPAPIRLSGAGGADGRANAASTTTTTAPTPAIVAISRHGTRAGGSGAGDDRGTGRRGRRGGVGPGARRGPARGVVHRSPTRITQHSVGLVDGGHPVAGVAGPVRVQLASQPPVRVADLHDRRVTRHAQDGVEIVG